MRKKSGFTLIELLVVIAIIGVLVSFGVANFITAQKQARDASRKQIIYNIQSAFEQYYSAFGVYPNQSEGTLTSAFDNNQTPQDPKNTGGYTINYSYTSPSAYCICAMLESATGNASAPSSTTCSWSSTGSYYCTQNKQ